MSAPRLPSPADLPHRLRERFTDLRSRYRQWREELRADPSLLWRTPLVRAALLLVGGLLLVLALRWVAGALLRPESGGLAAGRDLAIVRVACVSQTCRTSYSKELPLDFKDWPLVCPRCGQPQVYRAQLCRTCRTWFASPPDAPAGCPECAARAATRPAAQPPASHPADPDDAEDEW